MRKTSLRAAAAALLAVGALGLGATASFAADAAITTDSDVYALGDTVQASGTCPDATTTAVVEVDQDGSRLDRLVVDVVGGAWSASAMLNGGEEGPAQATVNCQVYGASGSAGTATTEIFLVPDLDFVDVDVTVDPSTVAIGDSITVSATCPVGTTTATVAVGNTNADDAFAEIEQAPGSDGSFMVSVPIVDADGLTPEVGEGTIAVFCEGDDYGFGLADFTITAAPAVSDPVADDGGDEKDSPLADTGTQAAQLAQVAFMLIVAGAVAVLGSRRIRRQTL